MHIIQRETFDRLKQRKTFSSEDLLASKSGFANFFVPKTICLQFVTAGVRSSNGSMDFFSALPLV